MFASADQVQDEDNDDQNGQGSPNGDRNHVVVNLVIIAAFHHTESICVGRHEWLNPEVEGLDRGIEVAGEIEHHSSIAGEGVAFVRVNGLDAIVFLESCRFDFFTLGDVERNFGEKPHSRASDLTSVRKLKSEDVGRSG